jgi:hypothetical protein
MHYVKAFGFLVGIFAVGTTVMLLPFLPLLITDDQKWLWFGVGIYGIFGLGMLTSVLAEDFR